MSLPTGSPLTVWWKIRSLGLRLQQPLAFQLWLSITCLSASGEGGPYMQPACSPLVFAQSFVLWACQGSPGDDRAFWGKVFFFFFLSLANPWFGLLYHISSLRFSSGHSGLVLTLRIHDAARTSLPSHNSLVVNMSVWATSLWQLRLGTYSVKFFSFLFMLPPEIPKSPTDTPVRVSYCVGTSPPFWLPPQDGALSLNLLSQFLSFIFCPTSFWKDWAAFLGAWCPLPVFRSCFVEVAQHSNNILMNFGGRKWSPRPIPLPSWDCACFFLFVLFCLFFLIGE